MQVYYRLFLFVILLSGTMSVPLASARLPETKAEQSLLYWRYLCHDEPQEEKITNQWLEFRCKTFGWTVRASTSDGVVKEITDP